VRFDIVANGPVSVLRMTETPIGVFKLISPMAQRLIRARNERSLRRLKAVLDRSSFAEVRPAS
jgi:hypothetical protein